MDERVAFRRASDGFVRRAEHVGDDQWSASTPCTEWDVRALVNHIAGEYLWVPEMFAGRTVAEVGGRLDGDVLGDGPLQALVDAQQGALGVIEEAGALERVVHLSYGDVPAAEYVKQMAIDSTIHAWDLACGISGDDVLDSELVELAYAELEGTADSWRSAGIFGPRRPARDDSVQARLLGLSGR